MPTAGKISTPSKICYLTKVGQVHRKFYTQDYPMNTDALFCSLSSQRIADLIRSARQSVCYAAPGVQLAVAQANLHAALCQEIA